MGGGTLRGMSRYARAQTRDPRGLEEAAELNRSLPQGHRYLSEVIALGFVQLADGVGFGVSAPN